MKFSFKAQRIATGEIYEGKAEALDKFALAKNLKTEGSMILSTKVLNETGFSVGAYISGLFAKVSMKEKIFFANNLAEMISAGLSLTRALSVTERQSTNKTFKTVMSSVLGDVNSGGSLGSAMAKFPKVFSPIFISMVDAGEKSGRLPESLKIVSDQMQKNYALRKKIRGALIYPAIIIIAMIGIGITMMIFVVPTLSATFKDIGAELPMTTKILIGGSDLIVNHGLLILAIFIPIMIIALRIFRTPQGQRAWAWLILRLPLFKSLVQEMNSAVTARTVSSLVASGVDIIEALNITQKVIQNAYYKDVIKQAAVEVAKGKNLSAIFAEYPKLYPIFVAEIVEVGEETGKLSDMLMKLAIFYENEIDSVTKDMSTIIEPIIMIIVGGGVGFFAMSMIQPIYGIGSMI